MKFSALAFVGLWLAAQAVVAQTGPAPSPAAVGSPVSLSQALAAAGENFDVAMARAAVDGAQGDLLAADHVPLPTLSFKAGSIDLQHGLGPGNLFADKRIDKAVGLDWTWERGNKRELRTAAALAGVKAAKNDLGEMRVQQQLMALSAFYDLLAAQQRQREIQAIARSAQAMAELMRVRLKAGDVAAQDLARVEIETIKARLEQDSAELERQRAALLLAQLLGQRGSLQVEESWPALSPLDVTVAADMNEAALEAAIASRSDVQAAQARVDQAMAALDGALAGRKADLTWGLSVDHFPGTSTRQVELRVQMPLQMGYGQQGEIARARAQVQQTQDLATKTRVLAATELTRLWHEARIAALKVSGQQDEVLPRARQVLAQAELAYSKGALSLTDLLDARRTLRSSLLDALAAQADFAKAQGSWRLRSAAL